MPQSNFEELLESAWVTLLTNNAGVSALVTAVARWCPVSDHVASMESSGKGLVTVQCTRVAPAPRFGNTLSAAPGYVELTAWTLRRKDPYGTKANNILGAMRDVVSSASIHTELNASAPRLVVYAGGVMPDGDTLISDDGELRQRSITIACHCTATP